MKRITFPSPEPTVTIGGQTASYGMRRFLEESVLIRPRFRASSDATTIALEVLDELEKAAAAGVGHLSISNRAHEALLEESRFPEGPTGPPANRAVLLHIRAIQNAANEEA